jgi:uncharacterized membrane protein
VSRPTRRRFGARTLRLRRSLVAIPVAYLVGACALGLLVPAVDSRRNVTGALDDTTVSTARDILTSAGTGMIAFTGFVVASVLVVVQFAAGQYSPRLVLWFRRDRVVKHATGVFLASFIYSLVALRGLERPDVDFTPDLTVAVAIVLLIGSSVLFLALLQHVTDRLRPRTLFAAVIGEGIRSARETYPRALEEGTVAQHSWERPDPEVVMLRGRPGVVASVDQERLVALATAAGATIELVPAVGEFVGPREALLRVHGASGLESDALRASVLITDERTIEQDPAFAIRIVVDTAIRALSPALNDPTTAVHALDSLEVLVRELAGRDLEGSIALDDQGAVRLVWPAPSWADVLELAFGEIRHYGATSVQVCRRLRAVLEDLREATPPRRHPAIEAQLRQLDASVRHAFPEGSADRVGAMVADRIGLGLARR